MHTAHEPQYSDTSRIHLGLPKRPYVIKDPTQSLAHARPVYYHLPHFLSTMKKIIYIYFYIVTSMNYGLRGVSFYRSQVISAHYCKDTFIHQIGPFLDRPIFVSLSTPSKLNDHR